MHFLNYYFSSKYAFLIIIFSKYIILITSFSPKYAILIIIFSKYIFLNSKFYFSKYGFSSPTGRHRRRARPHLHQPRDQTWAYGLAPRGVGAGAEEVDTPTTSSEGRRGRQETYSLCVKELNAIRTIISQEVNDEIPSQDER